MINQLINITQEQTKTTSDIFRTLENMFTVKSAFQKTIFLKT